MNRFVFIPFLFAVVCATGCPGTPDGEIEPSNNGVQPDMGVDSPADQPDATPDLPVELGEYTTPEEALAYVDPFIGTGGMGFAYGGMTPAAQIPNGMVKVGPDTTNEGSHPKDFHHFSGYYFRDPHIRGFSHLHLVGTGATDYGNLRVLPNTADNLQNRPVGEWWVTQDRTQEEAAAGYYATYLDESQARVELTSTKNAAVHRYTFDGAGPHYVTFDLAASVTDSGINEAAITTNGQTIEGWIDYKGSFVGRGLGMVIYFSATYSAAPDASYAWDAAGVDEALNLAQDAKIGTVSRFDSLSEPLELRVGISLISQEQARINLSQADGTFEEVRAANEALWLEKLSRVKLRGGREKDRETFFTALYNTYRMPSRFDEDGQYRGLDGLVHPVSHPYYTELSLWDTYRTAHPWFTLYEPEMQRDMLRSLLLMNADGGHVPKWPGGLSDTGGMIGTPADVLFGESAVKGIEGIDYDAAMDALIASHSIREDQDAYVDNGYIPADVRTESAALTLEFAVHDQGVATLADFLGRPEAATYEDRSDSYKRIWDSDSQFFRPRNTDGTWEEPFRPSSFSGRSGGPYVEGSGWHYLFHAPHDPDGLLEVMGAEVMESKLDELFEDSKHFDVAPDLWAIPDSHYWHGNQPPLASAFMYAPLGRLDKLGMWVRRIQETFYTGDPNGLAGNDDGGTLSAWLLFSAVGFYPIVATDRYAPSPPLFPVVDITLTDGKTISVRAIGAPENSGIQGLLVEEVGLDDWYITHDQLTAGPVIDYTLGQE